MPNSDLHQPEVEQYLGSAENAVSLRELALIWTYLASDRRRVIVPELSIGPRAAPVEKIKPGNRRAEYSTLSNIAFPA